MKIVVGEALNKKGNAELIKKCGEGQVKVTVMRGIQVALTPKNGQAGYYSDSCQAGVGGVLGMAIAMSGMDKCITVAMVGGVLSNSEILKVTQDGKKVLGFVPEAAADIILVIMRGILK